MIPKIRAFMDKWAGKGIDFDGAFGNQCVDVFRQYCKEVLNSPHLGPVVGAKDLYLDFDKTKEPAWFKRIPYVSGLVPELGDFIVYGSTPTNQYGHVALVLFASEKVVVVLEQNGQKEKDPSKVSLRTYDHCLGFLSPVKAV